MNLVIVEDNELVRRQLLRMIASQSGIRVVGIATSEEEAVSAILTARPDAVLLDLSLATGTGVCVLRRIRAAGCTARVLVLTNHTIDLMRQTCESLGIDGFLRQEPGRAGLPPTPGYSWLPATRGGCAMKSALFRIFWKSLRTRITLLVLVIVLASIWGLTSHFGEALREDYQRLLGEQQLSTSTYLAREIDQELADRLHALARVAGIVTPEVMADAEAARVPSWGIA
jgi:CheY-like chemotaxis protein